MPQYQYNELLCLDKIKIIRTTLRGPCKILYMKIRLFDASFLHGEVELTCFLVCDHVFESHAWGESRWKRQAQNEEWLTQIDRIIIPSHTGLYLFQSRPPWASGAAESLWLCQRDEREAPDPPLWHPEPTTRAVCQTFRCADWLIMSQGSGIRHLRGWHAHINERLLGACVFMWEVCVLNSWPRIQSNLSLIPLF